MAGRFGRWVASLRAGWCFWLVLALALIVRAGGVTHGVSFHPDERHIISVAERMLREGDLNPQFFAYGSLPFYLLCGLALVLKPVWPGGVEYDALFVIGRILAVGCGLMTVALTYLLGQRVSGKRSVGLVAALLLSLNVFHVQLSRFFTVDILLTAIFTATLYLLCCLAREGRTRHYVFVGALIGLALATKISALSLFAPFLVAVVLHRVTSHQWWDKALLYQVPVTVIVAGLCLFLAAPYSFLDWETFLRHNQEQISMTRGLWRPPYTVQYVDTTPFLYPLAEMFHYTLGPLLALFAGAGLVASVAQQVRRLEVETVVVLAGVIPVFIAVGGLDVKFPRYLLTIYPVLVILAAQAVIGCGDLLARSMHSSKAALLARCAPPLGLIVWCGVSVAAFVSIYRAPHVYETASRWIYERVQPGAKILGVHWDDKLPISLPGSSPHRMGYRFEGREHELEVYERDTALKIARLAEQLASHDYLVFPTARTYGSIPRLPSEYPDTIRMFSALFRGNLGYVLEQSFKVRPQIGSLTFDDDLADESFTVYDHPKVLVFRNAERLAAGEILKRIAREGSTEPVLSREQMIQFDSVAPIDGARAPSSWGGLLVWFVVAQLCALALAPFLAVIFDYLPDRGYGLSKALGALVVGFGAWSATWYGNAPTTWQLGWLILGALWCAAHLCVRRCWGGWRTFFGAVQPHARAVELLCGGGFLVCAALRALAPEIFWGEKPMDFTFLNYFVRLETLPPIDPWATGVSMGYYYFGFYVVALLHKMTGIDTGIGYNLALATIGAWLLGAAYSVGAALVRSRGGALLIAATIVCAANLEVFRLAFIEGHPWDFDLFWASSRVLTSPAITEYPIWSLLFADLHAHVIALPFVAALLLVAVASLIRPADPHGWRGYAESSLHGFLLGALFALNTWDFIAGAFLTGVFLLVRICAFERGVGRLIGAQRVLLDGAVIGLAALIVIAPFAATAVSTEQVWWGLVRDEFSTLPQVTAHLGQWAILLGVAAVSLGQWARVSRGGALSAVLAGSVPLILGGVSALDGTREVPWPLLGAVTLAATVAGAIAARRSEHESVRAAALLTYVGCVIMAGAEMMYLMDRMNTIFKFYHFVWLTVGVGSGALAIEAWRRASGNGSWQRTVCSAAIGGALTVGFVGTGILCLIMITFQRVPGPRPTLDGQAYLAVANPVDAPLIEWLRANVTGTPVVLEAHGDPYGSFTRIAMHTGLPTVLGWRHHVRQRGVREDDVVRRARDIETIYNTTSVPEALALLSHYGVSYIVVGDLERGRYSYAGLLKFGDHPAAFPVLKESRGGVIYGVQQP